MRTSSLTVTILAIGALVLTALVFVPISSQAGQVEFSGNTATGITNVLCGDNLYDVTFVFQTGVSLYGEDPDFPFKGASGDLSATTEEQTYACSRVIQEELNAASQAITRVGPQSSSYFYIGAGEEEGEGADVALYGVFESRYYDTITTEQRPEDTWVPADNFFIDTGPGMPEFQPFPFGSAAARRDVPYSWAKIEPASGSTPPRQRWR